MALMTRAEVKQFLKLTSTGDDALIDVYIPIIEDDLTVYCNNYFPDRQITRAASGGIAFVPGGPDTITDDDEELSTNSGAGFKASDDIVVAGTWSNDGLHTLSSNSSEISSGTLTLDSTNVLRALDQDSYYDGSGQQVGTVIISRVDWPVAIKPIAAKMIGASISDANPGNVKSETIDDYSVTYVNGHAYPERVMKGLDKWRQAVLI